MILSGEMMVWVSKISSYVHTENIQENVKLDRKTLILTMKFHFYKHALQPNTKGSREIDDSAQFLSAFLYYKSSRSRFYFLTTLTSYALSINQPSSS